MIGGLWTLLNWVPQAKDKEDDRRDKMQTQIISIQICPASHWILLMKYPLGWKKSVKQNRYEIRRDFGVFQIAMITTWWDAFLGKNLKFIDETDL